MLINQEVNDLRAPGEALYFYHKNHQGTPLALTDTDGVKVWEADLDIKTLDEAEAWTKPWVKSCNCK